MLHMGVQMPESLLKKQEIARHNNNDGEKRPRKNYNREKKNMSIENTVSSVSNNGVSNNNFVVDPAAPAPAPTAAAPTPTKPTTSTENVVVPLEDILRAGIRIETTKHTKSMVEHATEVGKTAGGVALGIGIAAGAYALGAWMVSLFDGDTAV